MKNVNIVVFAEDKKIAQKMKYDIIKEATHFNYFVPLAKVTTKIDYVKRNKNVELLIVILNDGEEHLKKEFVKNEKIVIFINKDKGIMENKDEVIQVFSKFDIRALAFSIVYEYYCKKIKEKDILDEV